MSNKTEGIATLAQDMLVLKRTNTLTGTRPQADTPKLESEIDQLDASQSVVWVDG